MTDTQSRRSSRKRAGRQAADWLVRHADIAVRLLVAPPAFGKTTALAAYAEHPTDRRRVALTLAAQPTPDGFTRAIADALGSPQAVGANDLGPLLAGVAPVELVIDDVHLAGPELLATLNALIADLPPEVYVVIAAQCRDLFDVGTLFARGFIAICDQSELALDGSAAHALFAAERVSTAPGAIEALVARTGGWPLAVVGALREAQREDQPLERAYERWQRGWAVAAIDLINGLLERVPAAERAATQRHFADGAPLEQQTLAVLHRYGFFVNFNDGTFSLMHWVDALFPGARAAAPERSMLNVTLFGRFGVTFGGVPIVWARRRDQQIVKYLLLHRNAAVTRAELAAVFWPGMARPLAMQNLRTACSTIRRAIGNVVGARNVDDFLIAGERLVLNRNALVCDVDRFRRHVESATADDAAGSLNDAIAHLRAAERLYGNGLFAGDTSDAVFAVEAQALGAMYAAVLARLSDALIERGSPELAREYAAKSFKLGFFNRTEAAGTHVHFRFAAS